MGLFDFLGGGSAKRQEKTIGKATAKLRNPNVQPQERQRTIEILRNIGTAEAVEALLQRFTMRTPGAIVDEDEKQMAYQTLLDLGDVCVDPIEKFIRTETAIYWPLRAITKIAGDDKAVELIISALNDSEHGYNLETERREQLVANLSEFDEDPRALKKLVELCDDQSDQIRILAVDGITAFEDPVVAQKLAERLSDEEETQRVKATVLDILAEREIDMSTHRETITAHITAQFALDTDGIMRRK